MRPDMLAEYIQVGRAIEAMANDEPDAPDDVVIDGNMIDSLHAYLVKRALPGHPIYDVVPQMFTPQFQEELRSYAFCLCLDIACAVFTIVEDMLLTSCAYYPFTVYHHRAKAFASVLLFPDEALQCFDLIRDNEDKSWKELLSATDTGDTPPPSKS